MRSEELYYDVVVIGGGLLGCFAARNLTRYDLKVALLEKREDLCTGISRANTAIVYSGCDTKPGTIKTSMCVRSAQKFTQLCDELGVRYSPCGSIMVSFGERGARVLREKLDFGTQNGVHGMRLLSGKEVLALEPNIAPGVFSGLYVPDTGTVMPWELCFAAAENAADNGVEMMLNTEVTAITRQGSGVRGQGSGDESTGMRSGAAQGSGVRGQGSGDEDTGMRSGAAQGSGDESTGDGYRISTNRGTFFARGIINCAGMSADGVLEMLFEPTVRIVPSAGDYYILDTKAAGHIRHVIFHEPEEKGKGLTLVPTVDGNILVGPTERPGDDYETSGAGLDELSELVSLVIPTLPMGHVIRSFGAVRPNPYRLRAGKPELRMENGELRIGDGSMRSGDAQLSGGRGQGSGDESAGDGYVLDDRSVSDFCIIESDGGAFVSLVGVKTPGLTCANELGMHTADKVADRLNAVVNTNYKSRRTSPVRLSHMPFDERELYLRDKDPCYSRIICRCRGISEGEIVDAIHRFPGATTLDGVKRRTGAGSGRCQSGFCGQRVIELLASELHCAPEDIAKDGKGSYFFIKK